MSKESVTLYYRRAGSDKVYQAAVEPKDGGFVVNFAYGRRGTTLQTGCKTPAPVTFEKAKAVYDKLVREKTGKGYTPGTDGTPYQHTDKEDRATGILPQLLNPITESEAQALIENPDWWMQEKIDGKRILLRKEKGEVSGINRKGLVVSLPATIEKDARTIPGDFLLDGECVGDVYHAFDCLRRDGRDLTHQGYHLRLEESIALIPTGLSIVRLPTAGTKAAKRELFARLQRERREGVVFKLFDAPYTPGRPASGGTQLKFKFVATASVMVEKVSSGKRSVALVVFDEKAPIPVGNVTIPQKTAIPQPGTTIDVRYLYAHRGGSLFQPVYLGVRDDLSRADCGIGQLKYKPEGDPDEEGT